MSDGLLREEAEVFAHVAQIAASAASLSVRDSVGLRHDLRLLRAELGRDRLRAGVVLAMVDAVVDELEPSLNRPAAACLRAARPGGPGPLLRPA